MNLNDPIYIAGHTGMVGSAIVRVLERNGFSNLKLRTHNQLNLTSQSETLKFMKEEAPAYVFMCAARVGGINANNTYRAEFIYENLMMEANIIHSAYLTGVKKLLFMGSSCIYPIRATPPIKETDLLNGWLEPTNEPYAIAKIAGIKMCENYFRQYGCDFISLMPCNLYGPNDHYDFENSHVIPALIRKIRLAKLMDEMKWDDIREDLIKYNSAKSLDHIGQNTILEILKQSGISNNQGKINLILWGSGKPLREFMHADDLARAALFLMEKISTREIYDRFGVCFLNAGSAEEISISALAGMISSLLNFKGLINWDASMPDGAARKILDSGILNSLGWKPQITIDKGLKNLLLDFNIQS